ncbi:MAG TPA: FMN-binding negative transcriptional regulator, partial [Streptosporangiaceae bacterium]
MYVPRHFAFADLAAIGSFVDAAGTADLVTFDGTRPVATLLPVIWDRPAPPPAPADSAANGGAANGAAGDEDEDGQELGRLLGHIALANDQWRTAQPGAQALAIVRGPQAYISPSWYASKAEHGRVVPT